MRIAVLGSNGQLGRDLLRELAGHELFPLTRAECDVTDHLVVRALLSDLKPAIVVNTTAYHRVDDCESQADLAYGVNALAVLNLIRIANDIDAALVHFSTDYVFDGASSTPYREDSVALPLSIYGNSKLAGELLVRTTARRYFLIRTCGLYGRAGSRGKGGNFVETMLAKAKNGDAIRVVNDQTLTPTSTFELARQVSVLLKTQNYGLYHATCEGSCSWYEFAAAIFEISGITANLSPTTSESYKTPASRPPYSVLENAGLKRLGLNRMANWRDALAEYLWRKNESLRMNSSKLRVLPFVALLLPLDLLVACILVASAVVSIPLRLLRRREARLTGPADLSLVTIQILNWDGLHLLEESLPAVIKALRRHSDRSGTKHEVMVVDNGSHDGSVEFLRRNFPEVQVVALDCNYGFSLGNNKGLEHVRSDIVVFLNNDMTVAPDFLQPLLEPFVDSSVFAVASQVYFSNPEQRREETGKTRGQFEKGFFRFWHDNVAVDDDKVPASPIFWAGGGSCAVDVRKLKFLGGFDTLYHPFYVEDADISYQAWKRGWRSLFAARSHVIHKHRGTSRPKFGDEFVDRTIRRNQFLFVWKNVTDPSLTLRHLIGLPQIHGSSMLQRSVHFEFHSYLRAIARLPIAVWRRLANSREYVRSDREVLKFTK